MTSQYCQALAELRSKSAHKLNEVGDQWCTPDNIFWGINAMFGPLVLDLFSDGENSKCADYYTVKDNALAQDWSARLTGLNGVAFANPPYSRATQHEDKYITGMRYIMQHASAMREKGGRYVFLIKAATSEVWWPEDADHVAFIRGRIGFDLPSWFVPADEKQIPSGAFFAGAIAVFDKNWRGPAMSYISRKDLEAHGDSFLAQIRREAARLVQQLPQQTIPDLPQTTETVAQEAKPEALAEAKPQPTVESELPLTKASIIEKSGFRFWACACAAFGDKDEYTFSESRFAHTWASDSVECPEIIVVPPETIAKAVTLIAQHTYQQKITDWLAQQHFDHDGIRADMQSRLFTLAPEMLADHDFSVDDVLATMEIIPPACWHNIRSLRARFRILAEEKKANGEVAA
ncbi:phage N-6-adenine-methyltransferase [Citrobacter freundii]|nr:phage N-6-adenine-methyltransferase [Citrobacter freundii]